MNTFCCLSELKINFHRFVCNFLSLCLVLMNRYKFQCIYTGIQIRMSCQKVADGCVLSFRFIVVTVVVNFVHPALKPFFICIFQYFSLPL